MSTIAAAPAKTRSWPRRRLRALLIAGAVLVVLLLAAGAGASWHFASAVLVPDMRTSPRMFG